MLISLGCFCFRVKVPYHIEGGQPSYFIVAGLVFTPLSDLLIEYVLSDITLGPACLARLIVKGYMIL